LGDSSLKLLNEYSSNLRRDPMDRLVYGGKIYFIRNKTIFVKKRKSYKLSLPSKVIQFANRTVVIMKRLLVKKAGSKSSSTSKFDPQFSLLVFLSKETNGILPS